jgi:protein TonB
MPQMQFDDFDMAATQLNMATPVQANVEIGLNGASASDGEYLPIVKVQPMYPNRAASRGIEGYCIVQYTVTTTGTTRDPVVTDCPNKVFARASMKAALKFKYKPRVVDGVAVEVPGVRNKFTFQLDK